MADYALGAVYEIRKLLWKELQDKGIMVASDYVSSDPIYQYVPIMPVQEQSEFKTNIITGKPELPYIVYDLDVVGYGTDWMICEERLTFKIYSKSYNKVIAITNLMVDLFRRFDDSAKDLNKYVKTLNTNSPFRYHYFALTEANSPNPAEELDGRLEADIAIVYSYSRDLNTEGRFA
jgi:hypothetical protein